jgi:hypothetical protein
MSAQQIVTHQQFWSLFHFFGLTGTDRTSIHQGVDTPV